MFATFIGCKHPIIFWIIIELLAVVRSGHSLKHNNAFRATDPRFFLETNIWRFQFVSTRK